MSNSKLASKDAGVEKKKTKKTPSKLPVTRNRLSKEAFCSDTEGPGTKTLRITKAIHYRSMPVFTKFRMGISENGIHLIKQFEGFSKVLYNDPVGHCTIGYGTLVHKGFCNGSEPEEFKAGISEQRATELLIKKVEQFAQAVNTLVKVPLNQNQFDALVSFVYNVGAGALQRSTLLKELNKGHYDKVPSELRKWVKAGGRILPGLVKRRAAEAALYQKEVTVITL